MIDTESTEVHINYKAWPRVSVTVRDERNGWPLVLYFAHGGDGPSFLGFQVLTEQEASVDIGSETGLDPASFARLARTLPMYVDYARAEIEWNQGDRGKALTAMREAGKSRRGLPDRFYREIAAEYLDLVASGDPHPTKSIAETHGPIHKSRASRWIKEARVRGYIPEEKGGS